MPAISSKAPGKTILTGEHAVVYGFPAIAVPLPEVTANVHILANPLGAPGEIQIEAPAIQLNSSLRDLDDTHPFKLLLNRIANEFSTNELPSFHLKISSSIPPASGLGSGAAVTVAITRAISTFLGHPFPDDVVNAIAYDIEKQYHGTPSGIDNTVITYNKPVYFIKDEPPSFLELKSDLYLIVADTGIRSETKSVVQAVRDASEHNSSRFDSIFKQIGIISETAKHFIEEGNYSHLGDALIENHHLLQELGVSCPELDTLVQTALNAGALGAKLSGAGRGGNMIAMIANGQQDYIKQALLDNGAIKAFASRIPAKGNNE